MVLSQAAHQNHQGASSPWQRPHALPDLCHFILAADQWGRSYLYPRFADKGTDTQRDEMHNVTQMARGGSHLELRQSSPEAFSPFSTLLPHRGSPHIPGSPDHQSPLHAKRWFPLLPLILQTGNLSSERFSYLPKVTEHIRVKTWTQVQEKGPGPGKEEPQPTLTSCQCMQLTVWSQVRLAPLLSGPSFWNFRYFSCIWWCFPLVLAFRRGLGFAQSFLKWLLPRLY